MPTNLQDQLDEITARTRQLVQAERLAVGERAVEELFATGIEDRILPVGTKAPAFSLPDSHGRILNIDDMLSFGPVVVKFLRGRWCAYCTTESEEWRNYYEELRALGAFLVAITPQTEQQNDFMVQQHELPFPVLRDEGCKLASEFGLTFELPQYLHSYYREIMVNLPFINGESSGKLPMPGLFLLAPDRTILFAEAHADYRVRPEPTEVLSCIRGNSSAEV